MNSFNCCQGEAKYMIHLIVINEFIRIRFWRTMVAGGFGPYHRLWHGATPTKCTDVIHTPWAMPPTLGLGSIHRVGRVVSITTTNAIMSIFGCMHIIDYVFEYIHIFDTLLIN
jgi:hypothetical protein